MTTKFIVIPMCALGLVLPATALAQGLCNADFSVTIRWVGECAAEATSSSSFAAAICYGPGPTPPCLPSEVRIDANFTGGNSSASASCCADINGDGFVNGTDFAICGGAAFARAQTFWPPTAGDIVARAGFNSVGFAYARAVAMITIEPLQCSDMEIEGVIPGEVLGNFGSGIIRQVVLCGNMAVGAFYDDCGSTGQGVIFNEMTGDWEFSKEISEVGEIGGLSFADEDLDVNGDGRFTQSDVDELEDNLNSMAPSLVSRWDFNDDGEIDQSDVDLMQTLIDSGFGSGVFGDVDDDGDIDCDDRDAMVAAQGDELCDEGYNIALDADLDGDIDSDDLDELDALISREAGDFDMDGDVDGADQAYLLSNWGTDDEAADLNGDGVVNGADLSHLLANWGVLCP